MRATGTRKNWQNLWRWGTMILGMLIICKAAETCGLLSTMGYLCGKMRRPPYFVHQMRRHMKKKCIMSGLHMPVYLQTPTHKK
uniref:Truncated envelope glycoprotein n=1 Tax=Human immunodeficiency virus type 1 TaxID=11676 RepID=Q8ADI3_HV1|nr:truncated envelope glycoprotein [Human immunodeficiency virus 1]